MAYLNKKNALKNIVWYLMISIMVLGLSIYRVKINDSNTIYNNYDATYHVLLTMHALDENDASVHKWAPIITLGDELSKNARWGDTKADHHGNYYYSSFPQLGFVLPYVFLKLFNVEISLQNLVNFNFFVGWLAAFLLFSLIKKLSSDCFSIQSYLPAGLATIAYITSTEFLFSHGYNYWGHSVSQIFLICFLSNLYEVLTVKTSKSYLLMSLFGFLMAATEWTGYICLLVSMLYFLPRALCLNRSSLIAFSVLGLAGILAGTLFIIPFLSLIDDHKDFFIHLFWHATTRSIIHPVPFVDLLWGYYFSFSYYILAIFPLALFILISSKFFKNINDGEEKKSSFIVLFVIAFLTVAIENTVLKEHAISYTFDRLKLIVPIAMLIPYLWVTRGILGGAAKIIIMLLIIVAAFLNIKAYPTRPDKIYTNTGIADNEIFAKNINLDKALIGATRYPSSYIAILFHKNFHDLTAHSANEILNVAIKNNANEIAMINTNMAMSRGPGFRKITDVDVYDVKQKTIIKYTPTACDKKSKFIKESAGLFQCQYDLGDLKEGTAFNLTNDDWKKGIATSKAGFLVMGYEGLYRVGYQVEFSNQEKRMVTDIILDPPFLQVFVDGLPVDSDTVGWPHPIKIVK